MVTTTQILAERVLQHTCDEQCVDWALRLLESGREDLPICRLAAKLKPHNHFELAKLRDQILALLELDTVSDSDALTEYAHEILLNAANGDCDEIEAITKVKDLCITMDYLESIYDFYLLYFAWEDLQSQEVQWYWPNADRSNIRDMIHEQIVRFVQERENAG